MGFCLENYCRDDYENDGDNGGGGGYVDVDVAMVVCGGAATNRGNGNDSIVVSHHNASTCVPRVGSYVSSTICIIHELSIYLYVYLGFRVC